MHRIRTNLTIAQVQLYYADRWNITLQHYHTLNWEAFAYTNNKLSEREKRFVTKMLTKWLPVGYNLNKFSPLKHKCPFCAEEETVFHLFQCDKNHLVNDFTKKLEEHLQKVDTEPFLQLIIMQHFRTGKTDTPVKGHPIPTWYLASAGLIPIEWTTSQLQYMNTEESKTTIKGNQWTHSVTYWIIQKSYQIWQHRNHKLHGVKNTDTHNSQLHHHVRELYSQKTQLLPIDQKMFHLPLEQRLQ